MKRLSLYLLAFLPMICLAQAPLAWRNVDILYGPLPGAVHLYTTNQPIDTAPFIAYYLIADLKSKKLDFTTDTTSNRRLTPSAFYEKNERPLVVVNGTFFSFETNQNLNAVMRDGKLVSFNAHTTAGRGKDTFTYRHTFASAIGITKKRGVDVAWLYTDSSSAIPKAAEASVNWYKDSLPRVSGPPPGHIWHKWKMQTAIGGGPVLLQHGEIAIANESEFRFNGKGISEKHPRTAMGYTTDYKLIILAVEGRNPAAGGATLEQLAKIMQDLGCWEALNLDGGGSSCLLVNGKETIKPADKTGQRPVPAVFIISKK